MIHSLPTFFNGGGLLLAWIIIGGLLTVGMARMVRRDRPPGIPHGVGFFGDLEASPDWIPPRMAISPDPEPDSAPVQPTPGRWEQPPAPSRDHIKERTAFSRITGQIDDECPICRQILDGVEVDHVKPVPGRVPPRPPKYDSFRPL